VTGSNPDFFIRSPRSTTPLRLRARGEAAKVVLVHS